MAAAAPDDNDGPGQAGDINTATQRLSAGGAQPPVYDPSLFDGSRRPTAELFNPTDMNNAVWKITKRPVVRTYVSTRGWSAAAIQALEESWHDGPVAPAVSAPPPAPAGDPGAAFGGARPRRVSLSAFRSGPVPPPVPTVPLAPPAPAAPALSYPSLSTGSDVRPASPYVMPTAFDASLFAGSRWGIPPELAATAPVPASSPPPPPAALPYVPVTVYDPSLFDGSRRPTAELFNPTDMNNAVWRITKQPVVRTYVPTRGWSAEAIRALEESWHDGEIDQAAQERFRLASQVALPPDDDDDDDDGDTIMVTPQPLLPQGGPALGPAPSVLGRLSPSLPPPPPRSPARTFRPVSPPPGGFRPPASRPTGGGPSAPAPPPPSPPPPPPPPSGPVAVPPPPALPVPVLTRQLRYDVVYNVQRPSERGEGRGCCGCSGGGSSGARQEVLRDSRRLASQFQLVANALRPLLQTPALRADHGPDADFLRRFVKGDFFRTVDVELGVRRSAPVAQRVWVTDENERPEAQTRTFDFELTGGSVDERYVSAVRKLGQVWAYEARQWRRLFEQRASRHADLPAVEEVIAQQELTLSKSLVGTEALLTSARAYLRDEALDPAVERDVALGTLDAYLEGALEVLLAEQLLTTQKLTEGVLLKRAYARSGEDLALLRRQRLARI